MTTRRNVLDPTDSLRTFNLGNGSTKSPGCSWRAANLNRDATEIKP